MRIAHLSDLHFGHHDPEWARGLAADVSAQEPTLVVVSGDFTQRGTRSEFEQARSFLSSLSVPFFAVPGNHDVPMLNLFTRLANPYALYQQYIDPDLEPFLEIGGVAIAGLKTARRARFELNWAHGSISDTQLSRLAATFERASPEAVRVVVTQQPKHKPKKQPTNPKQPKHKTKAALRA